MDNKAGLVEGDNQVYEFSSTVSYSPSFSYYASGEFAAAAVQVSRENQSYNQSVKVDSVIDEDADFEFETSPLHEDTFVHFPPFNNDLLFIVNKRDDAAPKKNISESFSGNCLWSPLRSPGASKRSELSKSTHKPCRLKKFLTRSHSDASTKTSSQAVKGKDKTESYKVGEGDKRRKSYLPYRQDLIGVFAGIRGLRR